jgi:hypothetical protein
MTKKEIREYIQDLIHEYMDTDVYEQLGDMASTGLTSDDGNNVTSQRSRWDDEGDEMEFYNNTGAPYGGAEGNHYNKDTVGIKPAPGRTLFTKF